MNLINIAKGKFSNMNLFTDDSFLKFLVGEMLLTCLKFAFGRSDPTFQSNAFILLQVLSTFLQPSTDMVNYLIHSISNKIKEDSFLDSLGDYRTFSSKVITSIINILVDYLDISYFKEFTIEFIDPTIRKVQQTLIRIVDSKQSISITIKASERYVLKMKVETSSSIEKVVEETLRQIQLGNSQLGNRRIKLSSFSFWLFIETSDSTNDIPLLHNWTLQSTLHLIAQFESMKPKNDKVYYLVFKERISFIDSHFFHLWWPLNITKARYTEEKNKYFNADKDFYSIFISLDEVVELASIIKTLKNQNFDKRSSRLLLESIIIQNDQNDNSSDLLKQEMNNILEFVPSHIFKKYPNVNWIERISSNMIRNGTKSTKATEELMQDFLKILSNYPVYCARVYEYTSASTDAVRVLGQKGIVCINTFGVTFYEKKDTLVKKLWIFFSEIQELESNNINLNTKEKNNIFHRDNVEIVIMLDNNFERYNIKIRCLAAKQLKEDILSFMNSYLKSSKTIACSLKYLGRLQIKNKLFGVVNFETDEDVLFKVKQCIKIIEKERQFDREIDYLAHYQLYLKERITIHNKSYSIDPFKQDQQEIIMQSLIERNTVSAVTLNTYQKPSIFEIDGTNSNRTEDSQNGSYVRDKRRRSTMLNIEDEEEGDKEDDTPKVGEAQGSIGTEQDSRNFKKTKQESLSLKARGINLGTINE